MKRILCVFSCFLLLISQNIAPIKAANDQNVIYRKSNSQKKIALTFDDGPHPYYTPIILDILKEYGIHATFFVVGENADYYPELVMREIAEGHELGNHTYSHCHLSKTDPARIMEEISRCEQSIYEICEYRTKLFRPPEGVLPEQILKYAINEDYTVILWSIDTLDWRHTPPSQIRDNILSDIGDGDIILMHDYVQKSITPDALRIIIPLLLEQNYCFVTISELLGTE